MIQFKSTTDVIDDKERCMLIVWMYLTSVGEVYKEQIDKTGQQKSNQLFTLSGLQPGHYPSKKCF